MEYTQFRCKGCHELQRERVAGQGYCGKASCQRCRKNGWRREHYAADVDYRLTARDSTRAWLEAQGGAKAYYRNYRQQRRKREQELAAAPSNTPVAAPRPEQHSIIAVQNEPAGKSANSDAKSGQVPVTTGRYLLIPAATAEGANSDAIIVELLVINEGCRELQRTTDCY